MLTTLIVLETPSSPGRSRQVSRTIRSIVTPRCEAR